VGSYYYLMAQLPGIRPGFQSSLSYDAFVETASRFLSPEDLVILNGLSLEPVRDPAPTGSSVVDGWYAFERSLRLSLQRVRAARLSRGVTVSSEDDSSVYAESETAAIARAAVDLDNPLEAERYLDRFRLERLQTLSSLNHFDSDAVFAYGLALLLNERSLRFSAATGRASYTTIYNNILGE
jgi:hypothetical protein